MGWEATEQGWPVGLEREDVAPRSANMEPGALPCQVLPRAQPTLREMLRQVRRSAHKADVPVHGGRSTQADPKGQGREVFLLQWDPALCPQERQIKTHNPKK